MNAWILIVILNMGANQSQQNYNVSLQEFNSKTQCENAAKIIRESVNKASSVHCVNK